MSESSSDSELEALERLTLIPSTYQGQSWIIKAASISDPAHLRRILSISTAHLHPRDPTRVRLNVDEPDDDPVAICAIPWLTPLLQAIYLKHHANISVLLDAEADPNGISVAAMTFNAARFIRDGPREIEKVLNMYTAVLFDRHVGDSLLHGDSRCAHSLDTTLTVDERALRGRTVVSRFWTEPHTPELVGNWDRLPSPVAAASIGDIAAYDQVVGAGADVSAWRYNYDIPVPSDASYEDKRSFLAVSSPLHAAIRYGHTEILQDLLDRGLNVNYRPSACIMRSVTPLMACLMTSSPNLRALRVLLSNRKTDTSIRTPVFGVHVLHFAVAALSLNALDMLTDMGVTLESAGVTAIGHTLLHVACLPPDAYSLVDSEPVRVSIHDVRAVNDVDKDEWWCARLRGEAWAVHGTAPRSQGGDVDDLVRMVEHLCESGSQSALAVDAYRNTALHYLASHRSPSHEAIKLVISLPGGPRVWFDEKNRYGYTPRDILKDVIGDTAFSDLLYCSWRDD